MEALTPLSPPERSRTYIFPSDARVRFENVTAICKRESGSHRLEMADGTKAIVLPGFIAVLLDVDQWTF